MTQGNTTRPGRGRTRGHPVCEVARGVARRTAALAALAAAAVVGARPAAAQPKLPKVPLVRDLAPAAPAQRKGERRPDRNDDIPPSARPPAGMCRIWLDNVPAAQQPAPTDCPSAVRNRPANARVIFGDDYVRKQEGAALDLGPAVWRYAALDRAHGPSAGPDAPWAADAGPDSTPRRPAPEPRPASAPGSRPPARDDWEAGYAAGYRDAMQGRRPRVRGVDRAAPAAVAGRGAPPRADQDADAVDGDEAPTTAVVVVPPGDDPRYFNNGRYAPPGRANGVCLDRDADGWCDDPRFGAPVCRDLDGDGRCDDVPALASAPYPAELPAMRAGADVARGRGSATALRWLGTTEVIARVSDLPGTGSPSRVTWLDANTGALLQVWSDRDGDGRADRVEVYRDGRRVKLIGR